jgi:hypothetical protein
VEILWNAFPYRFGRFAHEIQMVMAVYFDQSLFTHGDGLFRIKNIAEIGALRANPVRWEATALPLSYPAQVITRHSTCQKFATT